MINESEIRLLSERKISLKTLSGYRKHFRVPAKGDTVSEKFLADLAEADLNEDLDNMFSSLRSGFGFKRKQLTATEPIGNFGEVATPGFTYEVSVSTIEDEPANVLWRRAISRIADADVVTCPEFEKTFGKQFNILELVLEKPIDVEDVIDEVEDCDDPDVKVDYEKDASWCRIEFRGRKEAIYVDAERIRVSSSGEISPADLIETFLSAHAQFFNVAK
ncbi:hypothetical protein [Mariniblastus fucicola]|uniref:Uncharacterized protein n=1 Tax=Mariniblastus fucicola TaxID=980251 RepID=A0A5B9P2B7_9BACT|nr:hypothetical protein [Mariniblastus fucicola]QEG20657.1 hypothetical protein MFFC18_05070 [Mariniblastus fucicola]